MPVYSENPTTSTRVLITTNGLETTDWTALAKELEQKCTYESDITPIALRDVSE
jgi:hypothetical protein